MQSVECLMWQKFLSQITIDGPNDLGEHLKGLQARSLSMMEIEIQEGLNV